MKGTSLNFCHFGGNGPFFCECKHVTQFVNGLPVKFQDKNNDHLESLLSDIVCIKEGNRLFSPQRVTHTNTHTHIPSIIAHRQRTKSKKTSTAFESYA